MFYYTCSLCIVRYTVSHDILIDDSYWQCRIHNGSSGGVTLRAILLPLDVLLFVLLPVIAFVVNRM